MSELAIAWTIYWTGFVATVAWCAVRIKIKGVGKAHELARVRLGQSSNGIIAAAVLAAGLLWPVLIWVPREKS